MDYMIGIDLGGTNIAAGLIDDSCHILQRASVKTNAPRAVEALCDDMTLLCYDLMNKQGIGKEQIRWVGIGSPGIISDGVICYANNLGLYDAPMVELLHKKLDLPVALHGDGNTAAYAEYSVGAGKGAHSIVMLTIGTGIGGGMIIEDKVYNGFNGAAPELGHIFIHPEGQICTCGFQGCFEAYCSASALINFGREAMEKHSDSLLWALSGNTPEKLEAKTIFDAKALGDKAAEAIVETFLDDLSIGIASVINLLQPERICIGGGVSKQGDAIIVPLRERVKQRTFAGREGSRTEILTAALGNDAGIIGAALLGNV